MPTSLAHVTDWRDTAAFFARSVAMKLLPILLCAIAIATLGACSGKPPDPQAKSAPVATPFDGLRADEQRAKDVQKLADKQAEDERKQIEAQTQ